LNDKKELYDSGFWKGGTKFNVDIPSMRHGGFVQFTSGCGYPVENEEWMEVKLAVRKNGEHETKRTGG